LVISFYFPLTTTHSHCHPFTNIIQRSTFLFYQTMEPPPPKKPKQLPR
jgi:hypothetical protein